MSTTNFLGGHAPERTDNQDAFFRFGWFCSGMRCRWHPPGPYLEKLGGFAPEWVVLLRNRAMLEACFGGKIAILGGFAPEFLSGLFTQILGGHAPVRALEEADRINACLERLPSREADVIRMNVIDGLSFVEISAILSIPQSTAKSRYKSGMEKLRKQFIE